ncbi:MAG: hypothetical protein V3576_00525, partial [Candidatus Cloacimonadota bacterium]
DDKRKLVWSMGCHPSLADDRPFRAFLWWAYSLGRWVAAHRLQMFAPSGLSSSITPCEFLFYSFPLF